MSAGLIGWIWEQDVSCTARLVLFALNEHTNIGEHGDWRIFPSHERIAKMCQVSRATVIRAMKELSEKEIITIAHQHDVTGRQLQNLYWMNAPKIGDGGVSNLYRGGCQIVTGEGIKSLHKPLNKEPLNKNMGEKRKRFIPPTQDDVALYCKERRNDVDAERFVDFYSSKGWMIGKNKMKCWKSAVRTWERNGNSNGKREAHKVKIL